MDYFFAQCEERERPGLKESHLLHASIHASADSGAKIFDNYLIGVPPIPIAIEGEDVILPYVKPCHGSFVLRIPGKEEVERVRKGGVREIR